jgi:hypothetical protein
MSIPETSATPNVDAVTGGQSGEAAAAQIDWEKRYKDTLADHTRRSQENARLRAELEVLKANPQIAADVQAELDELKYRDPDAWKAKLDQIEASNRRVYDEKLAAITGELTAQEQRKLELDDFLASNPGFYIDDDVINNELPRRLSTKLEKGEISFGDFLREAHQFLTTPKVIGNVQVQGKPNLDKMGGGTTPSASATDADSRTSYKTEIY